MAFTRAITSGPGGAHMLPPQTDHSDASPSTLRVLRFQPLRYAADEALQAAINPFAVFLQEQERLHQPRQRRRRADDLAKFNDAADAIVSNLMRPEMALPGAVLAVPRGSRVMRGGPSRYRPPVYGPHFIDALDLMDACGFIERMTTGYNVHQFQRSALTTYRPIAERLAAFLPPLGSLDRGACDFTDPPELIVLKGADSQKTLIDYPETAEAEDWRCEMRTINAMLRAAAITTIGEATEDDHGDVLATSDDRSLRRIFNNGDFSQGGRLYGGFWQVMSKADRFRSICIDDEPVCSVDFRQFNLRLAYALANAAPPPGDLYDLTGSDTLRPDWPQLREGMKKINSVMFNATKPLRSWPGSTPRERKALRASFPHGTKPIDVVNAIAERHRPIANQFCRGRGLFLNRIESDILVASALRLIERGATVLPLHDAVLTTLPFADDAKSIMEQEAKRVTGATIPAVIDTGR